MNNLLSNYMGFDGRINRQAWWISAIVLVVVQIIITWLIGLVIPGGIATGVTVDPAAVAAMMSRAGWQALIIGIIFAYPWLAISIKRRHDRNNNGYDAIGFVIVQLIYDLVLALLGFGTVASVVGIIFLIYAIYMLVQLGFLRGTAGTNQFGPDPLGG
jgi:uncharacterized membrane protein YhaH (DUF805 family)